MRTDLLLDRDFFSKPCVWKETCSRQVAYFNCRRDANSSCKEHRLNRAERGSPACGYRFDLLIHSSARQVTKGEPSCDNSTAIGRCGRIARGHERSWIASEKTLVCPHFASEDWMRTELAPSTSQNSCQKSKSQQTSKAVVDDTVVLGRDTCDSYQAADWMPRSGPSARNLAGMKNGVDVEPVCHSLMITWHDGFRRLLPGISRHVRKLLPGVAPQYISLRPAAQYSGVQDPLGETGGGDVVDQLGS